MASQNRAIVDKLLGNVSSAYVPQGMICEDIFPEVTVKQTSGKLGSLGTSHLRVETTEMIGKAPARRAEPIVRSTTSYNLEKHGLEGLVTEEDYANVEDPFEAEEGETLGLTSLIYIGKEKSIADTLSDETILTQYTTLSGVSQFSDYANSDPLDVCKTARQTVKTGCGLPPNGAIVPWEVAEVLRFHPVLLDHLGFKFARPGGLSDEELAKALKVPKVWVPMGSYESAKEGQTSSLAAIWGKHIVFGVFPEQAMKYQVSLGYKLKLAGEAPRQVFKSSISNPPGSTQIIVQDRYDYFLTNVAAAYLIKSAVA